MPTQGNFSGIDRHFAAAGICTAAPAVPVDELERQRRIVSGAEKSLRKTAKPLPAHQPPLPVAEAVARPRGRQVAQQGAGAVVTRGFP